MDVWVHCRGQQAVEVVVVGGETAVTVTVMTHWYWDWGHGESQVEPMAQHWTLEPAGSMMQYVLSGQQEVAPRGPMSLPVVASAPDLAVRGARWTYTDGCRPHTGPVDAYRAAGEEQRLGSIEETVSEQGLWR